MQGGPSFHIPISGYRERLDDQFTLFSKFSAGFKYQLFLLDEMLSLFVFTL